jgi:hypothetical protein
MNQIGAAIALRHRANRKLAIIPYRTISTFRVLILRRLASFG